MINILNTENKMTSLINPSEIDGAYPVAGQNNSSQGFRDNFTATKVNFQYAADEITQLQNNVVLKSPLSGQTINNDMMGTIISNAQIQGFTGTVVILGNRSGAVNVDFLAGPYQAITTAGPINLQIQNLPAAGVAAEIELAILVSNVAHTVTLPTAANVNNRGIVGLNPITNTITFVATGVYNFKLLTINGGFAMTVFQTNTVLQPFNATSESLAPGGTANLAVTTSRISINGNTNVMLPAGIEGLTKIFVLESTGGGTVTIQVTNAGWATSTPGSISLTTLGSGCTLRYTNGRWFCVGNNGALIL